MPPPPPARKPPGRARPPTTRSPPSEVGDGMPRPGPAMTRHARGGLSVSRVPFNRVRDRINPHAKADARRGTAGRAMGGRESSEAELELMTAMQEYKERSGRLFPTWSEVLEVLTALGYRREGGGPPPAA